MWFNTKPREIEDLGASCSQCGVSNEQKLVTRQERVGCLVSQFSYCQPCITKIEQERKDFEYQRKHYCNRCGMKFEKPYRRTRNHLVNSEGFHPYSMNLCQECYDLEIARTPRYEADEDLWPKGPSKADDDLWG